MEEKYSETFLLGENGRNLQRWRFCSEKMEEIYSVGAFARRKWKKNIARRFCSEKMEEKSSVGAFARSFGLPTVNSLNY